MFDFALEQFDFVGGQVEEAVGGEGLMLRQPESNYEVGRSCTLLKVKSFHDADAVVTGHQAGKGKHQGKMGALHLQMPDGTQLKVGTGFSDKQRALPPAIGSTITFRYQEFSDKGIPRFPSFVAHRTDIATTKVATVSKPVETKQASVSVATKVGSASENSRYFEFVDGKSSKFWEITVDDTEVTVRYGRIGSNGQSKVRSFKNPNAATAHAAILIDKKTNSGYEEESGKS